MQAVFVRHVVRSLDVKFDLRCARQLQIFDVVGAVERQVFKHVRVLTEHAQELGFEHVHRVAQDDARADVSGVVVLQERRDAQAPHGQARFVVDVAEVIVHVPVDASVRDQVDLRVRNVRDLRQQNGRTVCLLTFRQELVHVFEHHPDGDLFVCIVSIDVSRRKADEADLGMSRQSFLDFLSAVFVRRNGEKHFV